MSHLRAGGGSLVSMRLRSCKGGARLCRHRRKSHGGSRVPRVNVYLMSNWGSYFKIRYSEMLLLSASRCASQCKQVISYFTWLFWSLTRRILEWTSVCFLVW